MNISKGRNIQVRMYNDTFFIIIIIPGDIWTGVILGIIVRISY